MWLSSQRPIAMMACTWQSHFDWWRTNCLHPNTKCNHHIQEEQQPPWLEEVMPVEEHKELNDWFFFNVNVACLKSNDSEITYLLDSFNKKELKESKQFSWTSFCCKFSMICCKWLHWHAIWRQMILRAWIAAATATKQAAANKTRKHHNQPWLWSLSKVSSTHFDCTFVLHLN